MNNMAGHKTIRHPSLAWKRMAHPQSQTRTYYLRVGGNSLRWLIRSSYSGARKMIVLVCLWNIVALVPLPWRQRNFILCVWVHRYRQKPDLQRNWQRYSLICISLFERKSNVRIKTEGRNAQVLKCWPEIHVGDVRCWFWRLIFGRRMIREPILRELGMGLFKKADYQMNQGVWCFSSHFGRQGMIYYFSHQQM